VIEIVLVGVLVGAAVPALLQLRRTLRSAEVFFQTTGPKLNDTLEEASGAAAKIRAVAGQFEEGSADLHQLVETASGLVDFPGKVLGALRAWRAARGKPPQQAPET
jgi:ABC-type transporter Mla subunit MlaD